MLCKLSLQVPFPREAHCPCSGPPSSSHPLCVADGQGEATNLPISSTNSEKLSPTWRSSLWIDLMVVIHLRGGLFGVFYRSERARSQWRKGVGERIWSNRGKLGVENRGCQEASQGGKGDTGGICAADISSLCLASTHVDLSYLKSWKRSKPCCGRAGKYKWFYYPFCGMRVPASP